MNRIIANPARRSVSQRLRPLVLLMSVIGMGGPTFTRERGRR